MLSAAATMRLGLLVSIAGVAAAIALVPRNLNGEHIMKFQSVPEQFYFVMCDTNGIALHRLAAEIESYQKVLKDTENEYGELASRRKKEMAAVFDAVDARNTLDIELTRHNVEISKEMFDRTNSRLLALDESMAYNSDMLQRLRHELNARENAEYPPPPLLLRRSNERWTPWLGITGYERYYHVTLKWYAYAALVVTITICAEAATIALRYLPTLVLKVLRAVSRWVVGRPRTDDKRGIE